MKKKGYSSSSQSLRVLYEYNMMLEMPVAASPYNHIIFFVTFHSMQFPITAIREIRILKKLQHENVIKLKEIVTSPGTCFIYLFI